MVVKHWPRVQHEDQDFTGPDSTCVKLHICRQWMMNYNRICSLECYFLSRQRDTLHILGGDYNYNQTFDSTSNQSNGNRIASSGSRTASIQIPIKVETVVL